MTHFRNTFMGNVGFEEMKRYSRQGTEFGREIVNVLGERSQLEQYYAKGLRRLGQRIAKAAGGVLGSEMSIAWRTVGVEMEKESEAHRDLGNSLIDECVKTLSSLTENQLKPRRLMEQNVEASGKTWADRYAEHTKIKKRMHQATRENESLIDQIKGPRPKTEKDQQRLVQKQIKSDENLQRCDGEYYNSLIHLERARQKWEIASFECCDAVEDMEDDRFRILCHTVRKYTDLLYEIPTKLKATCRIIDDVTDELSPSKEVLVVAEKLKGVPYLSEQLLCDYYQENFSCQMSVDRRRKSILKLIERYIADCQKEKSHKDGLKRLVEVSQKADQQHQIDIGNKLMQSTSLITFFDVIRYKLNITLSSIDGSSRPHHHLADNIEQHSDKQGIMYSVLKLKPGESSEKGRERSSQHRHTRTSPNKSTKSSKSKNPPRKRSNSLEREENNYNHNRESTSSNSISHSSNSNRRKSSVSSGKSVGSKSYKAPQPDEPIYCEPPEMPTASRTAPPVPQSSSIGTCIALYDYKATREDEIDLVEGDIITVYEKGEDDWWRGKNKEKVGLFPANYVDTEINV